MKNVYIKAIRSDPKETVRVRKGFKYKVGTTPTKTDELDFDEIDNVIKYRSPLSQTDGNISTNNSAVTTSAKSSLKRPRKSVEVVQQKQQEEVPGQGDENVIYPHILEAFADAQTPLTKKLKSTTKNNVLTPSETTIIPSGAPYISQNTPVLKGGNRQDSSSGGSVLNKSTSSSRRNSSQDSLKKSQESLSELPIIMTGISVTDKDAMLLSTKAAHSTRNKSKQKSKYPKITVDTEEFVHLIRQESMGELSHASHKDLYFQMLTELCQIEAKGLIEHFQTLNPKQSSERANAGEGENTPCHPVLQSLLNVLANLPHAAIGALLNNNNVTFVSEYSITQIEERNKLKSDLAEVQQKLAKLNAYIATKEMKSSKPSLSSVTRSSTTSSAVPPLVSDSILPLLEIAEQQAAQSNKFMAKTSDKIHRKLRKFSDLIAGADRLQNSLYDRFQQIRFQSVSDNVMTQAPVSAPTNPAQILREMSGRNHRT